MKKRIFSFALVAIMVLGLTACGTKDAAKDKSTEDVTTAPGSEGVSDVVEGVQEDNSLQYILDKGELILGLDDSFPPMGYRDDADNIVGFDIDLAQAVCDKLGIKLVLQPIEWVAKEQELITKNIDCIWNGFSITEERLVNLTMSAPYMGNTLSLVVNGNSKIASMDDMKDKKMAVQSGSSAEEALDAATEFKDTLSETNGFDDYVTALLDLETGNSDAVLMDSVLANYMINEGGKDFKLLKDTLSAEEYAVGFRKGELTLCTAIEDALKELKADGTVNLISTKWFGSDVTTIKE